MNGDEAIEAAPPPSLGEIPAATLDDPAPSSMEGASAQSAQAADVRRRLIGQFEQWLDRMSQGEPAPEGLPPELLAEAADASADSTSRETDLYSLFASLTALTSEIKFQARGFKQLTDALAPFAQLPARLDRVEAGQNLIADQLAKQSADEGGDSGMPDAKDVLAVLFDMHERLERGLRTFDTGMQALSPRPAGWRQRLFGGGAMEPKNLAAADAMREGYRLALSRVEAALQQWGIERTAAPGDFFDPATMAAVDVQSVATSPDGTVLEVYRSGYRLHGRMLATAQVKVAKNAPARE